MKKTQLKITVALLLFCISNTIMNAQFICDLGQRTPVVGNNSNFELSALAYHQGSELFFMALDDRLPNTTARMRGYDPSTGLSFNVGLEGKINDTDFEGLTWLAQDYFVLVEERKNEIYFLQYQHSSKKFTVLSNHLTGIPIFKHDEDGDGIKDDKDGLEGVAYNRYEKALYLVSEMNYTLHRIPIELPKASDNSKGKLFVNQKSEVQLPFNFGACTSGIFHLALNVDVDHPLVNNILVLSDQLQKVFEFEMILDANNNLTNNSLNLINEFSLPNEPQAEGIVVVGSKLYIASEKTNGGLSSYLIKTENDSCNDGNANTINDSYNANCDCVGDIPGCINVNACNFDTVATIDNGTCQFENDTCNDGNSATTNDKLDENCNCAGDILGCTNAAACNFNASATKNDGSCMFENDSCNDANSATINDKLDENCNCAGEILGCTNAAACNFNASATKNDGTCKFENDSCNDGNSATINDMLDENCFCAGIPACQNEITVEANAQNNISLNPVYESKKLITTQTTNSTGADVIINQNETVDLKSEHIILNEGFKVDNGACLNVTIEPCK